MTEKRFAYCRSYFVGEVGNGLEKWLWEGGNEVKWPFSGLFCCFKGYSGGSRGIKLWQFIYQKPGYFKNLCRILRKAEIMESLLFFREVLNSVPSGGNGEFSKYKCAEDEIRWELREEFGGLPEKYGFTRDRLLPATLSGEECRELMTAFKKGKFARRNNLILRTFYSTGIRIEEMENLRFCDVNFGSKAVFIRAGKGDKDRYTVMDSETLRQLKSWMEDEGKKLEDSVFGILLRQIRRVVEEAGEITGIGKKYEAMGRVFSAHSMRHAFATHCYEAGMRLPTLQKLLGHSYILTTMVYLYVSHKADIEEYERTHPLERENPGDYQKAKHKCQYCGCESILVKCDNEGNPIRCDSCYNYLRVYQKEELRKKYERVCPHCGCTSELVILDKYGVPIECVSCYHFITLKEIEDNKI